METYIVYIRRTEVIGFEITATDPADADYRALMDGDEIGSETIEMVTESVSVKED